MADFFEKLKNADEMEMSAKMVNYLLTLLASREHSSNCCLHNLIIKLGNHSCDFNELIEKGGFYEINDYKVYTVDPQLVTDYLMGICMLSKFLYPMIEQIDTLIDKELKMTVREEEEE